MKKRFFAGLLALILCFCAAIPALAVSELPRVVDGANLLSRAEEKALASKLDEISQRHQVDVVVVTADTLEGKSPRDYADDFYDNNGYGFGSGSDGVLLLVSMEDRDWWISTCGYGIKAFTDAGIEYLSEQFLPELSDGDYAEAFEIYAVQCDAFITQAKSGDPYDSHNLPKEPFNVVVSLLIALAVGFVFALIVTAVMRGQLKTVRSQRGATNYVRPGSLDVKLARDIFLYSQVTRREKPRESSGSSTHRSSSGRSHGGGGGKF